MRRTRGRWQEANRPLQSLPARFSIIPLLFVFTGAAACGNGQVSRDRAGEGQNRSPDGLPAQGGAMHAMAEERIRAVLPKSYDCDHFNLERVEQVDLTAADRANRGTAKWCLHFEYSCRTSATGKRKDFASVVELMYLDADVEVSANLAMGPLFIWADPGFVGVNWMHCEAGTGVDPPF